MFLLFNKGKEAASPYLPTEQYSHLTRCPTSSDEVNPKSQTKKLLGFRNYSVAAGTNWKHPASAFSAGRCTPLNPDGKREEYSFEAIARAVESESM